MFIAKSLMMCIRPLRGRIVTNIYYFYKHVTSSWLRRSGFVKDGTYKIFFGEMILPKCIDNRNCQKLQ
jgi:hypothetical protein